jgi:Na+-transporting methylmalonyl-CoA/oxaloacetate decarboxylase gamma subunit
MKGSASGYGVSGAGEYNRVDYQEQRKDRAIGWGMILVVLALIAAFIWFMWSQFSNAVTAANPFKTASDAISGTQQAITKAYEETEKTAISSAGNPIPVNEAKNVQGNWYPVSTPESLKKWLEGTGAAAPVFVASAAALPTVTQAGVSGANTVNKLGLNDAYVDLGLPQKALVTVGEGIGMLFGVDLIQMGYDMRPKG